jgi:hypothetical protein
MTAIANVRVFSAIFALCLTTCARAETVKPLRADAVMDSIGVATHFNYMDGAYSRPDRAADALKYIGVTHLRDQTPTPWVGGSAPTQTYERLMDRGLHFDFLALGGNFDYETTAKQLRPLAKKYPGMIDAVEGFNEVDHAPVSFNGQSGIEGSRAAQSALYAGVKNDPALKQLPVFDLTGADWPDAGAKRADFANVHLYAQNGNPPGAWFNGAAQDAQKRGIPLVVTEFGYASNPQSGWMVIGVDERTQAKGIMLGIFHSLALNIKRTYIYELLDQKPDPLMKDIQQHFGLFRVDYQPKASAIALHNLAKILNDPLPKGGVIPIEDFNLDTALLPATVHSLVIAKTDGTRLIAIWNDAGIWDRATGKPIESAPLPVTLRLPAGAKARALYDPLIGPDPVKTYSDASQPVVDVPDHPVLLEVRP